MVGCGMRSSSEEDGAGIDEKENRADKKRQGENNDGKKSYTV